MDGHLAGSSLRSQNGKLVFIPTKEISPEYAEFINAYNVMKAEVKNGGGLSTWVTPLANIYPDLK